MVKIAPSAFLAGACIGIAGFAFLAVGGLGGMVLFAFGLLAVVHYGFKLYTGTAGFITKSEVGMLFWILLWNVIGCLAVSMLARISPLGIVDKASAVIQGRLDLGWWKCGLLSIGCGFIMTTAVTFARQGKMLPLLFGVPAFIACGFPHSVADAFYYCCAPVFTSEAALWYVAIVAGNFIGCNLTRCLLPAVRTNK